MTQVNSLFLHTCNYPETDNNPSILFYINNFSGARVERNFDDRMFKTCVLRAKIALTSKAVVPNRDLMAGEETLSRCRRLLFW